MSGGSKQPNIVFILTDDHASHAISAYGSVVNRTPRIDELGAHGARFENCFATNSLCTPSRASLLTGTYSHINGVSTTKSCAMPMFSAFSSASSVSRRCSSATIVRATSGRYDH